VLDHLGDVVGGEERLALAALGHRQVADEVGEPRERSAFARRVLVEVVVELPGLVADPQVVVGLARDVVEGQVVGGEDLVHPPQRLEGVEVVAVGFGGDVAALAGELGAGRMDVLAGVLEHTGDGVLGEPVDLQVGDERAQLACDRDVAAGVAEADR
jgi:hypothetical protein